MSKSISFDISSQTRSEIIPRARPMPPDRKPRPKISIDLQDQVRPNRLMGETYIPLSQSAFIKAEYGSDKDAIVSDMAGGVQLPLAPTSEKRRTVAEILTPEPEDKLMLVQLPSSLPIIYPHNSSQMDYNPLFTAADGHIGKIRIYKSGRVTATIGKVEFDVESGIPPSCLQLAVLKSEGRLEYMTVPRNKIKFTVDVEKMQRDMEKEKGQTRGADA